MSLTTRRYFIIEVPNDNAVHSLSACIGAAETQRYSLDGSKLLVKTNYSMIEGNKAKGITENMMFPPAFTTEYSLGELKAILQTAEWYDGSSN